MRDGPNIARIAGLVGDPARAEVLTTLLADRALTATELADVAGVTKQTMSAHLGKLLEAGLLAVEHQGRHRYFRLADRDVAHLLESLMGVAFRTGAVRLRASPRDPALRKARTCFDHLAGELAVAAYEALLARRLLRVDAGAVHLTRNGHTWFATLGIDAAACAGPRRSLCRPCLDWGERRHHLSGALGAALLDRILQLGWAKKASDSRVVTFSARGEKEFRAMFDLSRA